MKNIAASINGVAGAVVGVIKGLIVAFVFANILYPTGMDPVLGLTELVNSFMDGGLAGLLALLIFVSFL